MTRAPHSPESATHPTHPTHPAHPAHPADPAHPARPSRFRFRRRLRLRPRPGLLASALLLGLAAALAPPLPAPAAAVVTAGPGYRIPHANRVSNVGGFFAPDGSLVYCLEWGKESPTLASDPPQRRALVRHYRDWSERDLFAAHALVAGPGQTDDDDAAAAVQIAIWLRQPGAADPFSAEHRFLAAAIPDLAHRGRLVTEARRLNAEVDARWLAAPRPGGELRLVRDPEDPRAGRAELSGLPLGAAGELRLTGAVFVAGGGDRRSVDAAGGSLAYRLTEAGERPGRFAVSAAAELTAPGREVGPELVLWRTGPGYQDMAGVGPPPEPIRFRLEAEHEEDARFRPELSTRVPARVLAPGERLADTVIPRLAEGSAPWWRAADGTRIAVIARCRAHGPLPAEPSPGFADPAELPVAAESRPVVLGGGPDDPLGRAVPVEYPAADLAPGFYAHHCRILAEEQRQETAGALPDGYAFVDRIGAPGETQLLPMRPRFRTEVSARLAGPGEALVDRILPQPGPWLFGPGGPVELPLRGEVFWSEQRPERRAEPPPGAEPVRVLSATLRRDDREVPVPFAAPQRPGWVTLRWCVDPAELPAETAELVTGWCDDYGVPEETLRVAGAPLASTGAAEWGAGAVALAGGALLGGAVTWLRLARGGRPRGGD